MPGNLYAHLLLVRYFKVGSLFHFYPSWLSFLASLTRCLALWSSSTSTRSAVHEGQASCSKREHSRCCVTSATESWQILDRWLSIWCFRRERQGHGTFLLREESRTKGLINLILLIVSLDDAAWVYIFVNVLSVQSSARNKYEDHHPSVQIKFTLACYAVFDGTISFPDRKCFYIILLRIERARNC